MMSSAGFNILWWPQNTLKFQNKLKLCPPRQLHRFKLPLVILKMTVELIQWYRVQKYPLDKFTLSLIVQNVTIICLLYTLFISYEVIFYHYNQTQNYSSSMLQERKFANSWKTDSTVQQSKRIFIIQQLKLLINCFKTRAL